MKWFKQLVEKTLVQFRSKNQKIGISRETELLIRRPRGGIGVTMISLLSLITKTFSTEKSKKPLIILFVSLSYFLKKFHAEKVETIIQTSTNQNSPI